MTFAVSGSQPSWPDVVVDFARSRYRGRWTWAVCHDAFVCQLPTLSSRLPWLLPEQCYPAGAWLAALAQAIRATRRWEGEGPVGVRAWDVGYTGHLLSPLERVPWRQPMRAQCYGEAQCWRGTSPGPKCFCGLYAVHPEAAANLLHDALGAAARAVGVVSLFGHVIRHRYGWRAQYARIREVWWLAESGGPTPRTDLYPGVTWHRVEAW